MPSSKKKPIRCVLDETVLNADTVGNLTNMGLSIFADVCGKNRGVFVVADDDGTPLPATYSCLTLPPSFAKNAGIDTSEAPMATSNDIDLQLGAGNITTAQAYSMLQQMNAAVFASSEGTARDPAACSLGGLAILADCPTHTAPYSKKEPLLPPGGGAAVVRGATLAGLFVPAPWATGGQVLSAHQAAHFYTQVDFDDMSDAGLNTVVVPVPATPKFWSSGSGSSSSRHGRRSAAPPRHLQSVLDMAHASKLRVILQLVADPDNANVSLEKAVALAKEFAVDADLLAVQLPTLPADDQNGYSSLIDAARRVSATMPLLVPVTVGQLARLDTAADPYLYAALALDHTTTIADVASSNSLDDRMKMFYHESLACENKAPIAYAACYHNLPALVTSGFDLAVDDCATRSYSDTFADYGQCDRWDETVGSGWWHAHRQSLAARQLASYEQGLGWTFAAWKVWEDADDKGKAGIDTPAQLFSFKATRAAGLIPDWTTSHHHHHGGRPLSACLNPPLSDFVLGDATMSPTPAPPPDCGNGWWNVTIQDCSYWVPPPPCPVCDSDDNKTSDSLTSIAFLGAPRLGAVPGSTSSSSYSYTHGIDERGMPHAALAFGAGAVCVALAGALLVRYGGGSRPPRRGGYSNIPDESFDGGEK